MRTLPPVSLPVAATHRRATTAAADPPLEPPGIRVRSIGLRVVPKNGLIVVTPPPHSWVLVFPIVMAPARARRVTRSASRVGTYDSYSREPAVVRNPAVSKRSLWAIGAPSSGGA